MKNAASSLEMAYFQLDDVLFLFNTTQGLFGMAVTQFVRPNATWQVLYSSQNNRAYKSHKGTIRELNQKDLKWKLADKISSVRFHACFSPQLKENKIFKCIMYA